MLLFQTTKYAYIGDVPICITLAYSNSCIIKSILSQGTRLILIILICLLFFQKEISNKLQAVQVAHESQSRMVAERVGQKWFQEEVSIKGTKLTAVDVKAITFMVKHTPTVHTIR